MEELRKHFGTKSWVVRNFSRPAFHPLKEEERGKKKERERKKKRKKKKEGKKERRDGKRSFVSFLND